VVRVHPLNDSVTPEGLRPCQISWRPWEPCCGYAEGGMARADLPSQAYACCMQPAGVLRVQPPTVASCSWQAHIEGATGAGVPSLVFVPNPSHGVITIVLGPHKACFARSVEAEACVAANDGSRQSTRRALQ
jgi:hypothetical protein